MEQILHNILSSVAPIIITALELIGIAIIAFGSLAALYNFAKNKFDLRENKTKIILGEALALGLEFKLGSEIIKTVIVRDLNELIILGIIVVLRVVLTFVIHWEVKQANLPHDFKNPSHIKKSNHII